jgi:penicillin-binding protein 1C
MNKKRKKRNKANIFLIIASVVTFILAGGVIVIAIFIKTLPSPEQFQFNQSFQSTKIYDRTGKILLYEIHGEQKRTVIPFEEIPEHLKLATIAVEDSNFYNRLPIDFKAVLRAFIVNLKYGETVQGASTITQQLARNVFLTREKTIIRKIKEAILATEIELKYSKDEILNFYLNQIPYGSNTYGVEAAAQLYFNKSARDLTLAESAILVSLTRAPSYYSPWGPHKDDLIKMQHYALDRMVRLGFIKEEEAKKAKEEKIVFAQPSLGQIKAPHFVMAVREYLINKYGENTVQNGGLKVITTLDWDIQQKAEEAVKRGAARNTELYNGKNAALVMQDAKTGQILALVGSADYFNKSIDGNFNMPLQGLRQPGSALKPFVYLKALEKGYTPDTIIFDVPTEFTPGNPNCPIIPNFENESPEYKKQCFHPTNFDKFKGPISLKEALAQSVNIVAVKILYLVGLEDTLKELKNFGIKTLNNPSRYGLSLVLGGGEVKLIELVKAYSVLSQEGVLREQSMTLEVRDANNNILEKYENKSKNVFDSFYIRWINYILSNPEFRKPLFGANFRLTVFENYDVALKTGTTNDYRDAWAVGYTPSFVVGVWAGNSDNSPMQKKGTSILAAIPIWNDFLSKVINKFPQEKFTPPSPFSIVNKTMLNGNYINYDGSIHSILYYVNKNNPAGPPPLNPANDPQFLNWEYAVINWVQKNPYIYY